MFAFRSKDTGKFVRFETRTPSPDSEFCTDVIFSLRESSVFESGIYVRDNSEDLEEILTNPNVDEWYNATFDNPLVKPDEIKHWEIVFLG